MRRIVVVGAGAAGIVAAIFAASRGTETVLLERTANGGRKLLMSGGGRCNVLPARVDERLFVTDSSHNTLNRIVRSWPLREAIAFFEKDLGVPLAKEDGERLFPASGGARDVRDGLLALAAKRGVRVRGGATVTGLDRSDQGWLVGLDGQGQVEAKSVVMATGGLSFPETGSDGLGIALVRSLGHAVTPTYPALSPVTARPAPFSDLAGISVEATVTATAAERSASAKGGFLFTHRGYSGPAVLNVSHVIARSLAERRGRPKVTVTWKSLPRERWAEALRPRGAETVVAALRAELPERLALALVGAADVERSLRLSSLRRQDRTRLIDTLTRFELPWTGEGGYASAEVTGGGVRLDEIDARTMESRRHPGLFLCGEMLDAFGHIGGYNLLWAWVTGRAAGQGAAGREAAL